MTKEQQHFLCYCSFVIRNSGGAVCPCLVFVVASLPYMSIAAGVVIAIAFQEIHDAPHAEASAQRDNEGGQGAYRRSEKCHITHGQQEVERIIRVRHDHEQRRFAISQGVQFKLVIGRQVAQFLNIEGHKARATGNQDGFGRFA